MSTLLVLHALRIKGIALDDRIAQATGLGVDEVCEELRELDAAGFVHVREGTVSGWALTPAGRRRERELVAAELDASGARSSIEAWYAGFRSLNSAFLRICTDWQLRGEGDDRVLNDHGDLDYDMGVLNALASVGEEVRTRLQDVVVLLPRFLPYRARLDTALTHVAAGEFAWFTGPLIDSVHTVWFELHEDLLATLNVPRSSEVGT